MRNIIQSLLPHASVLDSEQLDKLQTLIKGMQSNLESIRAEGRDLRIAVVGQMKAGKSSFLNAAFFGRDLLPKADTPMTAALTKIVYAPQARAEVEFYSTEDWDDIECRAAEYPAAYADAERRLMEEMQPAKASPFAKPGGHSVVKPNPTQIRQRIPEAIKSSLELVDKAREQQLNVRDYLGKKEVISNIEGAAHLADALQDYVGSNGKFTAITKMSVLYVDDPRLQGLEIIDTPGFNDPVVSRGQITRRFLGQCDVIFLLSSVSQFLTSSDMSVLREQLPEAGIDDKAIFLIGSQRDIALRQDHGIATTANTMAAKAPAEKRNAARAVAMMQLLDRKLNEMASTTLDRHIHQPDQDEKTRRILSAVRATPPRSVSSWAWLIADHCNALSDDDSYQLDELRRITGYPFDAESLRQLSNIPTVRDDLLKQRERKNELLASKEALLLSGLREGARKHLNNLVQALDEESRRIQTGKLSELEKTENALTRMETGRAKLEDVFDEQFVQIRQKFAQLTSEVRTQAKRYKVTEQKETKTESYEVSTSRWYKPWTWGDTETRYRQVVTVYASAQDAIEQVESFADENLRGLQRAIVECVDLDGLRKKVSAAAMNLFDTSDANFDADLILTEINKSLRRLTIPDTSFGVKSYSQMISKSFGSGRVSQDKIDGLAEAQREAIATISADLEAEVNQKIQQIGKSLEKTSRSFVTELTKDIQQGLTELREKIRNREDSIRQIDAARTAVQQTLTDV